MSATKIYGQATGRIINAYIESVGARAVAVATRTYYDQAAHEKAAVAFDRLISRLDAADDALEYLDDWFSGGNEIVIRQSREPLGIQHVFKDTVQGRLVDILYVFEPGSEDETQSETVSEALRAVIEEDARV